MQVKVQRLLLHNHIHSCSIVQKKFAQSDKKTFAFNFVVEKLRLVHEEEKAQVLRALNAQFFNKYFDKWTKTDRHNDSFLAENEVWLNNEITVQIGIDDSYQDEGKKFC